MAMPEINPDLSAARRDEEFLNELAALMEHEFFGHAASSDHKNNEQGLAPTRPYSYKPLVVEGAIRVFFLAPGIGSEELKGSLETVLFDKNDGFESLSYAWGSPDKPHSVTLPEGSLPITKSLYTALTRLRRRGKRRCLWIDAICIDQTNNEEKVEQILLMQQIYSNASCVLAWLGEDDGNGTVALQFLEKLKQTDFSSLPAKQISVAWMEQHGLPAQGDPIWYRILAFWQRSWFRRAWVVQEFVMARDVTVICGRKKLNWKSLSSGIEKMVEYGLLDWGLFFELDHQEDKNEGFAGSISMRLMLDTKSSSRMGPMLANAVRSFSERDESGLRELREGSWSRIPFVQEFVMMLREEPERIHEITDVLEKTIEGALSMFGQSQAGIKLPLLGLFHMFEYTETTVPRDKLFALLGLAKDGDSEALRPDYHESTESVLLRYATYFVQSGQGVAALYGAGIAGRDVQLPSWVPNWTQRKLSKSRSLAVSGHIGLSYAAASDAPAQIRVGKIPEELIVSASYLDVISRTLRFPSPANEVEKPGIAYAAMLKAFFDEADDMFSSHEVYVTGESLLEVQWRTLIGNLGIRPQSPPEEFGQKYLACRKVIDELKGEELFPNLYSENQYFARLLAVTMTYDLCEMRSGLFGMMPMGTQVGDSIYFFAGSRMPFVMRPFLGDDNNYQIVGPCYVHGMMNGEALRSEEWKPRDICIR